MATPANLFALAAALEAQIASQDPIKPSTIEILDWVKGSIGGGSAIGGGGSSDWVTLRQFSAITSAQTANLRPSNATANPISASAGINTNIDFVALSSATEIELRAFIKLSGVAASVRVYFWVYDGTETYILGVLGGNPGENAVSVLDSNSAYDGVAPGIFQLKRATTTLRAQAIILLDVPYIVFDNTGACVNPGFAGNELVNLNTTGILPAGLSGEITSFNATADTIAFSGLSLNNLDLVRYNLQASVAGLIPPLNLGCQRARAADVNVGADTITLDGSASGFSFSAGQTVRVAVVAGSTLPTPLANSTTYTVLSVSGSAGSQTLVLSSDGGTRVRFTASGAGLFYVFLYPYANFFFKSGNQLSLISGGAAIDLIADINAIACTVVAGAASVITSAAHGLLVGDQLILGGTTAPGGGVIGFSYWVDTVSTANTFTLRTKSSGGYPINFTSAGTSVQFYKNGTAINTPSVAAGTASTITIANAPLLFGAAQPFTLTAPSGSLPTGYAANQVLYAISTGLATSSFQWSDQEGGVGCVFGSAGTAVLLSANFSNPFSVPLEKTQAYIAASPAPTDTSIAFSATSGGGAITLAGGSGTHSINPVATPQIASGSYVKARAI